MNMPATTKLMRCFMLLLTAWVLVCGQSVQAKLAPSKFFALAKYAAEKNAVQSLDVPSEDEVLEERSCQEETVHTDVLGTPRKITRASDNALVWTWLQDDPWGGNLPTGSLTYNLRYAGQYYDSETGLHENRYRYYDPKTGRYLTPDPIGLAGGMHRYNYTAGDPINATDPMGLFPLALVIPARMLVAGLAGGAADASLQYATTGKVDWWQAADSATDAMMFGLMGGSKAPKANTASKSAQACEVGQEIKLIDGFYQVEGSLFKFSEYYYNKLWFTGRGAPFLQAEEVLNTLKKIEPDRMAGFNRYTNNAFEMVYNPTTKEVWHIQPINKKR
jgi:RHS repeat-associated protein